MAIAFPIFGSLAAFFILVLFSLAKDYKAVDIALATVMLIIVVPLLAALYPLTLLTRKEDVDAKGLNQYTKDYFIGLIKFPMNALK